jgi:hypothetical protein
VPSARIDADMGVRISLHLANRSIAAMRKPRNATGLRKRLARSSIVFRGRNAARGALALVGLGLELVFRLDTEGGAGPRMIDGLFDWPGWKIDENEVRVDIDGG